MEERIRSVNSEMDAQGDKKAAQLPGNVISCATWDLDIDPVRLPPIPSLPNLNNGTVDVEDLTRLIKIAGLDGHLIGLTNKGHVLKFGPLESELTFSRGRWEYVRFLVPHLNIH
jgi:SCF-associated factor 1